MKVEVKLKRTASKKLAEQQAQTNSHFPSVWNLQCFAYSTLKLHMRDFETRKKTEQDTNADVDLHDWELVFSSLLEAEINKISSFYEDRHNECVEGLKGISSEISNVSLKSAETTHAWHEFIVQYGSKAKPLETREETPTQFVATIEGYAILMAEKSIEQSLLNVFKKLAYIHKLSLHLKNFAQFNITEIKKLLRKHDEVTTSISTLWMERIRRESFGAYDCFEKIVSTTKDLLRPLTPSSEDFICPICLGLLCEPVAIHCGHKFCDHCLVVISASCTFCPLCRMDQQLHPSNHIADKPLKQYLKQFFPAEYKASLREHKSSKRKITNCTIS